MPARHYFTAADVLAMPEDGNRYEVVHGELLVSPGPRLVHQRVVMRLAQLVANYLDRFPVGEAFPGGNISWSPATMVIPDLLVVDRSESSAVAWDEVSALLLVVEVLSPSTADQDRFTKRRLYQEVGVPLYWLVDADTRTVEVWTPEAHFPVVEETAITWHPAGAAEPLTIPLAELFQAP
ncbi:MAG: Uma2 family endonuclease [Gemmatimonadales bacterium]